MKLKDKLLIARNIIIHGKTEGYATNKDVNFVCSFLETTVDNNIIVQSAERIRKLKENKKRLIKVVFKNTQDKERVMGNLRKLKGKKEFEGINIRHDLTLSERKMMKVYLERAKVKNDEEVRAQDSCGNYAEIPKVVYY